MQQLNTYRFSLELSNAYCLSTTLTSSPYVAQCQNSISSLIYWATAERKDSDEIEMDNLKTTYIYIQIYIYIYLDMSISR